MTQLFNNSVPTKVQTNIKSFIEYAKDNFISEFKESLSMATIESMSCEPCDGFIPINMDGGYKVTEKYFNNEDSSYCNFTKEQTKFNTAKAERSWKEFCVEYKVPKDTLYSDDLTQDLQTSLEKWESGLFEPALLHLRCFVTCGKVKVDVSLDYSGGDIYNWNLLVEKEFSFEEVTSWKAEDFERICSELKLEIEKC